MNKQSIISLLKPVNFRSVLFLITIIIVKSFYFFIQKILSLERWQKFSPIMFYWCCSLPSLTQHRKGNENPVELAGVKLAGEKAKLQRKQPCTLLVKRCLLMRISRSFNSNLWSYIYSLFKNIFIDKKRSYCNAEKPAIALF